MSQKTYDFAIVIGRFSPFHIGHKHLVDEAFRIAHKVIIIIGSHHQASTTRNPWYANERKDHIKSIYPTNNLLIGLVRDFPYNDNRWISEVQSEVSKNIGFHAAPVKICLVGHSKKDTESYLKMFPQWDFINIPCLRDDLNATMVRKELFLGNVHEAKNLIPNFNYLTFDSVMHKRIAGKMADDFAYRETWGEGPFVTTDCVVTQGGHLLVIERNNKWDQGLYALPGGFLDKDESLIDGAFRELHEETNIDVPDRVLKGCIKGVHTFDSPHRDSRARIITTAYYIDLGTTKDIDLPKVKGSDDAIRAMWVPISSLQEWQFYSDHMHIANWFLNFS